MTDKEKSSAMSKTSETLKTLFAGLRGKGIDDGLDVPTAVMIPIIVAMVADGLVEEEELLQIRSVCESSPIFERNSWVQNDFLIYRTMQLIEERGLEGACQQSRERLSVELRETAFGHAMRVIFSDGYVGRLENEVVEQMIDWLEIDRDRARMIVEVVSILQHAPTA